MTVGDIAEQIEAMAPRQSSAEWDPGQVRDAVMTIVANEAVQEIIDRVYPVRVATIQDNGTVILNQGGDRLSEGMVFEIFKEGEEVFDQDTKESLGKVETLVATVRVARIAQKMSFAQVISGDASKISKGLVCRAKPVKKNLGVGAERNVIRTKSGGVLLPFDR